MSIQLREGKDLARISRELRKQSNGKELRKQLSKQLRKQAKPLVPVVRASIRAIPSSRSYSADGLRGRMSRATKIEVKTSGKQAGVAIRVDGRKMPSHMRALPAYMEGTKRRWKHPVWGNRNAWASQSAHPYFFRVMRAAGPRARRGINAALDDISKKIT